MARPPPQPLPSRLRACPLPAILKVTKPRQAGVWLGGERTECAAPSWAKHEKTEVGHPPFVRADSNPGKDTKCRQRKRSRPAAGRPPPHPTTVRCSALLICPP